MNESKNNSEYNKLLLEYAELQKKYTNLKHEYAENTIIISMNDMKDTMNDMKEIYDSQKIKIKKLNDIVDAVYDTNKAIKIMLNTLSQNLYNVDTYKHQFQTKIQFIIEMIDDCLKKKIEILYLNNYFD